MTPGSLNPALPIQSLYKTVPPYLRIHTHVKNWVETKLGGRLRKWAGGMAWLGVRGGHAARLDRGAGRGTMPVWRDVLLSARLRAIYQFQTGAGKERAGRGGGAAAAWVRSPFVKANVCATPLRLARLTAAPPRPPASRRRDAFSFQRPRGGRDATRRDARHIIIVDPTSVLGAEIIQTRAGKRAKAVRGPPLDYSSAALCACATSTVGRGGAGQGRPGCHV